MGYEQDQDQVNQYKDSFFQKYSINIDTHTHTIIHSYEHIYAHPTSMSTFKKLRQIDLKIHEVGHQKRLIADGNVASLWKNN
jgi:hypothetical protein